MPLITLSNRSHASDAKGKCEIHRTIEHYENGILILAWVNNKSSNIIIVNNKITRISQKSVQMITINLHQLHITRNHNRKVQAIQTTKLSANYLTTIHILQHRLKEITQVTKYSKVPR